MKHYSTIFQNVSGNKRILQKIKNKKQYKNQAVQIKILSLH